MAGREVEIHRGRWKPSLVSTLRAVELPKFFPEYFVDNIVRNDFERARRSPEEIVLLVNTNVIR